MAAEQYPRYDSYRVMTESFDHPRYRVLKNATAHPRFLVIMGGHNAVQCGQRLRAGLRSVSPPKINLHPVGVRMSYEIMG